MKNVDSSYPWERQTKETEKAYEAFLLYKNAGPGRTVIDVARKLQKSYTLIRRWAKKWNWEDRVLAFDRDCERFNSQASYEARPKVDRRFRQRLRFQFTGLIRGPTVCTNSPKNMLFPMAYFANLYRISKIHIKHIHMLVRISPPFIVS